MSNMENKTTICPLEHTIGPHNSKRHIELLQYRGRQTPLQTTGPQLQLEGVATQPERCLSQSLRRRGKSEVPSSLYKADFCWWHGWLIIKSIMQLWHTSAWARSSCWQWLSGIRSSCTTLCTHCINIWNNGQVYPYNSKVQVTTKSLYLSLVRAQHETLEPHVLVSLDTALEKG